MKILIAYDGSRCSEAAIDDLARSGLPATGVAEVISVAETWLPPQNAVNGDDKPSQHLEELVKKYRKSGEKAVAEAKMLANYAEQRVRAVLPDWEVSSTTTYGSPAWEILEAAERLKADLIVVGSHGQSALNRFMLGSISQRVLTEAHCSVRIARGSVDVEPGPERIIIGFDCSRGAAEAVRSVAGRNWSKLSEVRLIAASEPVVPNAIGRFVQPLTRMVEEVNVSERGWLEQLSKDALQTLRSAGLESSLEVRPGNPKQVLVEEAERWGADCVFLGANAVGSRWERVLIGSTSAAVSSRAHCSVEVVRVRGSQEIPNRHQN